MPEPCGAYQSLSCCGVSISVIFPKYVKFVRIVSERSPLDPAVVQSWRLQCYSLKSLYLGSGNEIL